MLEFLNTGLPWWIGALVTFLLSLPVAILTGIVAARMVQYSDAKKSAADAILGLADFVANKPPRPTEGIAIFKAQMRAVITQFAHLGHYAHSSATAEVRDELVKLCCEIVNLPDFTDQEQKMFSKKLASCYEHILNARSNPQAFFHWGIFD